MWRVVASLGILLIAGLAVLDARCVADCAAIAQLPPCHRHSSGHQPKCAITMATAVRPVSVDWSAPEPVVNEVRPLQPLASFEPSQQRETHVTSSSELFSLRI